MDASILAQEFVSALSLGCIYGLIALGYSFIFNAAGLVNVAQGSFVMYGGYIYGVTLSNMLHLPLIPSMILLMLSMGLMGVLAERLFYRPFAQASIRISLVGLQALGILMANAAIIIWNPYPKGTPGPWGQEGLTIQGVTILYQNIFVIVATIGLLAAQQYFFHRTVYGKYLRAVAIDKRTAALIGIDTDLAIGLTFAYSCILAGVGGMLISPFLSIDPTLGNLGFKGFGACVVGSFTSTMGAMAGGLMIGFVQVLATSYISSAYKESIIYLFITLFLLFRPQGLFGKKSELGSL